MRNFSHMLSSHAHITAVSACNQLILAFSSYQHYNIATWRFSHAQQEAKLSLGQPTVLPKLQGLRDLGHAYFQGKFLCACFSFSIQSRVSNLKYLAQVVLEICSIICQKFQASRDLGHAHFRGNFSAFPIQSCIPNLKSLAEVVFEILRFKRIGVTSLTSQGHVTSSVT